MRRAPIPNLLLAATLALILPLEQAHCAWMGLQKYAAPAASAAATSHACCKPHTAPGQNQQAQPEGRSGGCLCEQLPAATLPLVILIGGEVPTVTALAGDATPSGSAPVSVVLGTFTAVRVGSPPLPHDPGAHGLRAPPVGA